jgi:hypothetical protein
VGFVDDNGMIEMYTVRMNNIHRLRYLISLCAIALYAPLSVLYAQDTTWIDQFVQQAADVINAFIVPTLMVLSVVVFVWGVVEMMAAMGGNSIIGDAKKSSGQVAVEQGKNKMVWGVVGLFVMIAVWGLVALLTQFVGVAPTFGVQATGFCFGPC